MCAPQIICTFEIRKAKENYYHNLFTSMKNYIQKTWSVINEALTPNRQKRIVSIIFIDALYDQVHEISYLLNGHYSSIGKINSG